MGIFKLAITGQSFQPKNSDTITKFAGKSFPNAVNANILPNRISRDKLSLAYLDPITFNSINTFTRTIMKSRYELVAKNKTILKYYDDFLNNIGNVGDEIVVDELFELIYLHQLVYGNAYVRLVKKEGKIIDLVVIDPQNIDYLKNASGKIALNNNKPIGYVIKTNSFYYGVKGEGGDNLPEGLSFSNSSDGVFLNAENIAHFKINALDKYYGIGFIEPGYKSIIRKLNIEEGQANSIYRNGFNPLIGYVGSERRVASPKDLEWINGLLAQLDQKKTLEP